MTFHKKVIKAVNGNDKAFYELVHEQRKKLYRIAYLYVKNEDDAVDIFQETVYKAYRSIHDLKDANYFSTWLTRILINTSLDFIKKNRRIIPFEEIEGYSDSRQYSVETHIDLIDAIDQLPETYKTVVILRYYRDYTIREIADVLECPEGTVKTNIHRATGQLKKDLKEDYLNEKPL